MSQAEAKVLLIGYGNPGRQDDGLGPALTEAMEKRRLEGVSVEANYQLNVEDAAEVARHEVVVFADAAVAGPEPFCFRPIQPVAAVGFTSHSVSPEAVLGLARDLFAARTKGYVLAIRGYAFGAFGETLSAPAKRNLDAAAEFLENVLKDPAFREGRAGAEPPGAMPGRREATPVEEQTCATEST